MKLLFLNAYFEPELTAFTHLEKDIINTLTNAGHTIEVITPQPTRGIDDKVVQYYKNKKSEYLYNEMVHVRRFVAPREGKNPIIRAFRYLWCNIREYQIALKCKEIDIIFCNSTPPTQGYLAGIVKKRLSHKYRRKIPFIFDLQDIFPDSLVNVGLISRKSFLWNIGRYIENQTYKSADCIITISEGFAENIKAKGVNSKKIKIIPNWVNTNEVYPVDRWNNTLFEKYKLNREFFYICYSGNIGHSQNLELILKLAKELENNLHDLRFVFIGDGAAKEELRNKVRIESIHNIIMLPFQPYENIAEVFSLGDVGLIISKPGIGKSSVPSKTWSIMAAARPILASFDEESELFKLIYRLNCGKAVQAGNYTLLHKAIIDLYKNRDKNNEYGMNGRNYLNNQLNAERCLNQYLKVIIKYGAIESNGVTR